QQIADTLDISVKTVENQVGKALKLLRGFIRGKQAPIVGIFLFISFMLMRRVGVLDNFMFY
ncbi:MAG TPA: hypothetical protein VGM41_00125, partial [Chitinophagaceae bacterium]